MNEQATCPVCTRPQVDGLLCHACTSTLEYELGDVPAVMAELDVSLSKQAKIGAGGGSAGLARERTPIGIGAMQAADVLTNTLTTWARDVAGQSAAWLPVAKHPAAASARSLLSNVPQIRRHPAVIELMDEITDAVRQARRAVDRPADRQFVGPCLAEYESVTCTEDLYAKPHADEVRCKVCGTEHEVAERRAWLLGEAEDRLFTVRESAQIIGSYANLRITESTIRNYVSDGQIAYHGKVAGSSVIRLGDLLQVIAANATRRGGKRLTSARLDTGSSKRHIGSHDR